jgi:hypothetical protein
MEQFLDPAARFVPDHDCGNLRGHARARGETDEGVHAEPSLLGNH